MQETPTVVLNKEAKYDICFYSIKIIEIVVTKNKLLTKFISVIIQTY